MRLAAQAKGGYYPTPPRVVDLVSKLLYGARGRSRSADTLRILDPCVRHAPPSMEPPPFSDGNVFPNMPSGIPMPNLQWSHRLSAMETRGPVLYYSYRMDPSMERPPFSDGISHTASSFRPPFRPFNGATAFQRWKPGHHGRSP